MTAELDQLEREVADARLRVKADLQRLRTPAANPRYEITTRTRRTMDDYKDRFIADLKDRVAANPVATAAIAAGIAWRLVRKPPIATMLIGGGLYALLRSNPSPGAYDRAAERAREVMDDVTSRANEISNRASELTDRATAWAGSAKDAVQEQVGMLRDTAAQAADAARAKAASAAQTVDRLRTDGAETRRGVADRLSAQASAMYQRAPDIIETAQQNKDAFLLGLASAAIVAAIGISAQRRYGDSR